jgi:hypothetical protein
MVFDVEMNRWTGVISATEQTRYFIQVVDGSGNVSLDDNKGAYHSLAAPLPLLEGNVNRICLPLTLKGG